MDVQIGNVSFGETAKNMTFDEFKEFVIANKLGKSMLVDVQIAYDKIQGCKGCDEKKKKPVPKVEEPKKKTVKKKP